MIRSLLTSNKKTLLLLSVVAFFGVALRLTNLTYLPIFGDEAIYIRWAQLIKSDSQFWFVPLTDGKQPLFMWLVAIFLNFFADPLVAGRLVSVFTGLGTLIGVFVLGRTLFKSEKAGLAAAFFYALSPFSFFYDRMALADSLLSMFGTWYLFFALQVVRTLKVKWALIAGVGLGGALITKSPALFYVLLTSTTAIFLDLGNNGLKRVTRLLGLWAAVFGIGYTIYNGLRLSDNFHMIGLRNDDYVHPISHLWTNPLDPLLPYLDRTLEWFWILGPWSLLVFALTSLLLNCKSKTRELLLLLAWWLIPIFINAMYAKGYPARYVLFTYPFFLVLAGGAFNKINFSKSVTSRVERLLVVGLAVFIFQAMWFTKLLLTDIERAPLPRGERSGYLEEWTSGTGIKEVANYIRQEFENDPQAKIVVGTEGYFGTLPDGLQIYLNDVPQITVVGTGLDFTSLPASLTESKMAGNKTYFVVNSSRLHVDPATLNLRLIAVYPKAFRPDGIREYVQFGPRDNFYLFEVVDPSASS